LVMTLSRLRSALGLAVAVALIATACGNSTSNNQSKTHTDSITIAANLQMVSFDAILANTVPLNNIVYDPLSRIGPKGELQPALAARWTGNGDATQWTFTLRSGVKFSDGSPFAASDVVFTYNKINASPTSQNKSYLSDLASMVANSPTEVVFNLKNPVASWPRQVTLIPIVSEKAYNAEGPTQFASRPVGTGPYTLTSFTPNQQSTFAANKYYWGTAPAIPNVTEMVVANETSRLTGLQSRSIDVAVLSPATATTAQTDKGLTVQSVASNLVSYIGFNENVAPLDNLKFRQAVDMAIDRNAIAKSIYKGQANAIGQLLAPATFGHDSKIKPTTYDANQAKQLVQQSGYSGQTIALTYPNGPALQQGPDLVQAIEGYLKAVGINVSLKSEDQATFVADWFAKKLTGMYLFSFQPSTLDATLVYNLMLQATNYFKDPNIDALYKKQNAQADTTQRAATLSELAKAIQDNVYYASLLNGTVQYVDVTAKLKVTPRADGYLLPQFMNQP
jgi:peptide/nickel transport system substrate-binding protein